MLGKVLAQRQKAAYCNSLKPWVCGDTCGGSRKLYNETEPSAARPLVVAFDEVDTVIDMIISNSIVRHKNIPVSIGDKPGWNTFFDMINDGMYPYLIIVMTANSIKDVEPSMLATRQRAGRLEI